MTRAAYRSGERRLPRPTHIHDEKECGDAGQGDEDGRHVAIEADAAPEL